MAKSSFQIEPLTKLNYDTWKVQAQAVLIKNGLWGYVSGSIPKPESTANDQEKQKWETDDLNARSDLILITSPSEIKLIKNCLTSKEVWETLKNSYESKGPARKATLLKRLILHKMKESDDIREHLNSFLDTVDKLSDMEITINNELLSIMMLYSLPQSFENFRIAIESRDVLPNLDMLKTKIIEEHEARSKNNVKPNTEGALFSGKFKYKTHTNQNNHNNSNTNTYKPICKKCNRTGHKTANCWSKTKTKSKENSFKVEPVCLSVNNETEPNDFLWCLDSGSTSHMCSNKHKYLELEESSEQGVLKLASKNLSSPIKGSGHVELNLVQGNISLPNVLYVPDLTSNLLSVSKITDKGYTVVFRKHDAVITNTNDEIILKANKTNGLYYVNEAHEVKFDTNVENQQVCNKTEIYDWHSKLGHLNVKSLMKAKETLQGIDFNSKDSLDDCEVCIKGKLTRKPFHTSDNQRTTQPLEIVHSDVCGPFNTPSLGGSKYFVTFIDEYTRYSKVYFLKHKNEVLERFQDYKNEVENFTGYRIKFLQSDNERAEYCNKDFEDFLKKCGIQRRLSAVYTPQQNGLSERKNRSLLDKGRCLLIESKLPDKFWAEAINTANYLSNRCPTRVLKYQTPFELWVGHTPSVRHLYKFGSKTFVFYKGPKKGKFYPRAHEGIFMGYSEVTKAFRIWNPKKEQMEISRDIKVLNKFYCENECETNRNLIEDNDQNKTEISVEVCKVPETKETETECQEVQNHIEDSEEVDESEEGENLITQNRPERHKRQPTWMKDYETSGLCQMDNANVEWENSNDEEWQEAIKNEIKAHLKNDTWTIIDKKKDSNVIGYKMILKNKYNAKGEIERKKARLVARGFSQIPGLEYKETYSPVAKLSSIRFLIGVSVEENLKINQMDITTAFLHGEIEEDIYMEKPKLLEKYLYNIVLEEGDGGDKVILQKAQKMLADLRTSKNEKVCKLNKALYGLKQSSRQWFTKLDNKLKQLGFTPSSADPCIYISSTKEDRTIIAIYVDDILVASNNEVRIEELKKSLSKDFELKDLGQLNYCLGIDFTHGNDSIFASQRRYIDEVLDKFGMSNCKSVSTPMENGLKLSKSEIKDETLPYQKLIGSLLYLSTTSRPDISFAVSYLSQFNNCYQKEHWNAAKRVLRYLQGTKDLGLLFKKTGKYIKGSADADWAGCTIDRRSYSGYCFIYAGTVISWEAKKQKTVSLSTAEAEYTAISEATKEALHLKKLANDMGINHDFIQLYNDNQAAQNLCLNPIVSSKSKHIDIKIHFIREVCDRGDIKIMYKPTTEMEADILTKPLASCKHIKHRNSFGLCNPLHT